MSGIAPGLERGILALYAELAADIERESPKCRACGDCCDFPKQGYLLYATSAEVDLVVSRVDPHPPWPSPELCPFHVGGKCALRQYRPLGCRTYYCESFAVTGPCLYAAYHDRLKALIADHDLDYRYAPFLDLLAAAWGERHA